MRCPRLHSEGEEMQGAQRLVNSKGKCVGKEMNSKRKLENLALGVCKFIIYIGNIFIKTSQGNKAN